MNTPAYGIELPRFSPVPPAPLTYGDLADKAERLERHLREMTTPRPSGAQMRAPVTAAANDPEFESGERLARGVAASFAMDGTEDTLVCER